MIPISKYIEKNSEFRLSLQCQFVDKFFEVAYFDQKYRINKRLLSYLKTFYENKDISKRRIDMLLKKKEKKREAWNSNIIDEDEEKIIES